MKKLLTLTIIALIALIGLSVSVNAADVSDEATIKEALVGTDTTITLTSNITLTTPIDVEREVTIDLNGYSITPADNFNSENNKYLDYVIGVHRQGNLTIKDSASNGKVSNAGKKLVVVKITVTGENDATYPAEFTLQNGILEDTYAGTDGFAAISGNGYRHNTAVTINGGTVKSNNCHAVFQPQNGKMRVTGGTIQGVTGIEVRSGSLIVTGGTIKATATELTTKSNGSGTTTVGAGIAIAQHSTVQEIDVSVEGGKIEGVSALYQSNVEGNAAADIEKIDIEVSGGEFIATDSNNDAVYSEDKTGFITGGTFSSNVNEYLAENTNSIIEDENGNFVIPVKLDAPTNVKWDGTKATWDAVPNAASYVVIVCDEHGQIAPDIVTEDTSVDLAEYLTDETKEYIFVVIADSDTVAYLASVGAESEAYVFPEEDNTEEDNTDDEITDELPGDTEDEEIKDDDATGEETPEKEPADDKDDDKKDDTPATGSIDVVVFASVIVAVISVVGIALVKKYTR